MLIFRYPERNIGPGPEPGPGPGRTWAEFGRFARSLIARNNAQFYRILMMRFAAPDMLMDCDDLSEIPTKE